jgi:para-nitrobenzyl esterase
MLHTELRVTAKLRRYPLMVALSCAVLACSGLTWHAAARGADAAGVSLSEVGGASSSTSPVVATSLGLVRGVDLSGVSAFLGMPYATPPVGPRRWQAPGGQPTWTGVRDASQFAARCMQAPIFPDMVFRNSDVSEDCLYLNVWTPTLKPEQPLPVLVYFYGSRFMAGDGSEPRYDGESMARRGIVTVTLSYRLGVFGFLAHPALSATSPTGTSGNYGLLDQQAALRWVRDHIGAFGGDPARVTIAGESAGSASVSAQVIAPGSRALFAGAIGESGAVLGTLSAVPRAAAEGVGLAHFPDQDAGAAEKMRTIGAADLIARFGTERFPLSVDGDFFTVSPEQAYASGDVAPVPLIAGWNSHEMPVQWTMPGVAITPEVLRTVVSQRHPEHAEALLSVYAAATDAEAEQALNDLQGDGFIGLSTWRWLEQHARQTEQPTYRYLFFHPRPASRADVIAFEASDQSGPTPKPMLSGAGHSFEIEYAMGNLASNRVYDWQPADQRVSLILQGYFENFIRTGNPNGLGLAHWPQYQPQSEGLLMHIGMPTRAATDPHRARYELIDRIL